MSSANIESRSYWAMLTDTFGNAWNRFWFTPADIAPLAGLRILVGILALYYVASHSADLVRWYGPQGILTTATVEQLTTPLLEDGSRASTFQWSYLKFARSTAQLWGLHLAGMAVVLMFTTGAFTRLTSLLSAIVVLSYIHRSPMLNGPFESVLSTLMIYLCVGPCGGLWSVDAWRWRRSHPDSPSRPAAPSILANISLRLLQIHVAGFYLLMGLSQLGGAYGVENSATWWRGEALWWLIAKSESRVIDLTFLSTTALGYVVNAWTHAIVFGELAFGLLIWKPIARPLLLTLAALGWLSLAPVTGMISYSTVMIVGSLAFLPVGQWRAAAARLGL